MREKTLLAKKMMILLMIAELDAACARDDYYSMTLSDELGNIINPAILTAEHIGQRLSYRITNDCANSCWGYMNVESKQGPQLDCPDIVTSCIAYQIDCPALLVEPQPSCNGLDYEVTLTGETFEFLDCGDYTMQVQRSYRAVDELGNESTCSHSIFLEGIDLGDIAYPVAAVISW